LISPGEVLDALALEAAQDLTGAVGDLAGETGETGNVDAVGGGLGAPFDAVEKDDLTPHLLDGGLVVLAAGQEFGEARELVVVGGEEREDCTSSCRYSAMAHARLIPS